MASQARKMNMLQGSLWDKILIVALPFALTGMMQQFFNALDIAMLGQFVGKEAMAAVGSNSSVLATTLSLFIGISLGANVVIASFIGKKDTASVHKSVHTAILVSLLCGISMTVVGEVITNQLLNFLSVPLEIRGMAEMYLRIYFLGLPVIFLYNFESAIFRSQGDTRTPLYCLIAGGIIKAFLNLFFILQLGMSAEGVAIGTIVANTISSGLLFYFLRRSKTEIRVRMHEFAIDKPLLVQILKIGLPAGLQNMVFSLSNLCIQSAINSLGPDVMAASAAAFNIEIFTYFIINAFGQVCTTFTSQNYGARLLSRCKRVFKLCLAMDSIVAVAGGVLTIVFADQLLRLFNSDAAVISIGYVRLFYIQAFCLVEVVLEIVSGAMRGYGNSLIPAVITLFGICGTRVTWVYTVFANHPTFDCLMTVFPLSWFVTSIVLSAAYIWFLRHLPTWETAKQQ